ncbi:hypothetical protein D3C85_1519720 [compost metagenome]
MRSIAGLRSMRIRPATSSPAVWRRASIMRSTVIDRPGMLITRPSVNCSAGSS